MIDNKATGKMIAKLRQAKGLTQLQLAGIIGVSHQAVSKWESGAALPDIQTMMALTRFFGITVEQLVYAELNDEIIEDEPLNEEKEMKHMSIQQLLMMAPFMSKEAVEEIALTIETPITSNQLAKLAPHLRPEALETLIEKHGIVLTWESLKKIAPFMTRESIDDMARRIASGEKVIGRDNERFDKAMNDIGKAFDNIGKGAGEALDDLGRGVKKAVKKAVKFGEVVINDVTEAFADMEKKDKTEESGRSERMVAIRKKAFERAVQDEKWDWIAAHLSEIEGDNELKAKIAEKACACGMSAWVCEHLGAYADTASIEKAIKEENWAWLTESAWLFTAEMQKKTALAAAEKGAWQFLADTSGQLKLEVSALEIAKAAMEAQERSLAAQIAGQHLSVAECNQLAQAACDKKDGAMLEMLVGKCEKEFVEAMARALAMAGEWKCAEHCFGKVSADCIENLMDIAVDQGNFDAIDALDNYA